MPPSAGATALRGSGIILAIVLAACSSAPGHASDGGSDSPDSSVSDAPAAFCARFEEAYAARLNLCFGAPESFTLTNEEFEFRCADRAVAVAVGSLRLDPAGADACIAALQSRDCATAADAQSACAGAFVGLVQPGRACSAPWDCTPDSFCSFDQTCNGTCTVFLAPNQPCDDTTPPCANGYFCDSRGTHRCVAYAVAGESCGADSQRCLPSLVCTSNGAEGARVCVEPHAGDACRTYFDCGNSYLVCLGAPSASSVCTLLKSVGDACAPGVSECRFSCDATGKCRGPAGIGEPCAMEGAEPVACAGGFCDTETGLCRAWSAPGASCVLDSCPPGFLCGSNGVCGRICP